jgi:2-iminobutanoate/2-iminopropanoate deaminase
MASSKPAQPIGPYTPVVRAGDWIIVSGQLGIADGKLVAGGVAAQTAQAVVNLKARLKEAGASISDVSKTLCFLTDMDTFPTFNEAYVAGFGSSRPARSTIGVAALPFGGAVEIEAWAYKPLALAKKSPTKSAAKKTAKKAVARKSTTKPTKKAGKTTTKKTVTKSPAKKSRK